MSDHAIRQAIAGSNLLKALRPEDLALLTPHLYLVNLRGRFVLYEAGDAVEYTYFPCGPSLVSFMVELEDARGIETILIGREGAIGGIVSHGHLPAYCRIVVQFPGPALRISCSDLEAAKKQSASLNHFFMRYADCLLAQMFQSVACNATHTIEQRAAKWLVAAHDRTGASEMPLTQDHLARLLGVGRSYVARVMGKLKTDGAIHSVRGNMTLSDIDKLKKISCACNDLVRAHFDEVLSGIYPEK